MNDPTAAERLNALLSQAGMEPLPPEQLAGFLAYLSLILRWNARTNLTAICDEEGILARHFLECIACARALPAGIATLLDFGSGAGLPGIPIALCRPEIAVTLAESQGKKAAFLREVVRTLGLGVTVHASRAELLGTTFDSVVLRAVDKMREAVAAAAQLVSTAGWLALMTTHADLAELHRAAGGDFSWETPVALPGSDYRILSLGRRG